MSWNVQVASSKCSATTAFAAGVILVDKICLHFSSGTLFWCSNFSKLVTYSSLSCPSVIAGIVAIYWVVSAAFCIRSVWVACLSCMFLRKVSCHSLSRAASCLLSTSLLSYRCCCCNHSCLSLSHSSQSFSCCLNRSSVALFRSALSFSLSAISICIICDRVSFVIAIGASSEYADEYASSPLLDCGSILTPSGCHLKLYGSRSIPHRGL